MVSFRNLIASACCSAAFVVLAPAQEHGKPPEKPAGKPAAAAQAPAKPAPVFVIANHDGKHEVMAKEALEAKNKQLAEDFAKAMKKFEADKKAAEDAKKPFTEVAPKHATIEAVGGEFPTKEAAESALKKMTEEAKAKEKPKDGAPPKPKGH